MPSKVHILFLPVILGCGVSMSGEKGPLNLMNDLYWDDPLSHTGDIGMERLSEGVEGMLIDMPPKVFLDSRRTIPMICLRTQPKAKAFHVSLRTTTRLIVSHHETGRVQVVKLAQNPAIRDSRPPSKGWMNEWLEVDVRKHVDLGPSLGRYSAWLVCGPESSNLRTFEAYPSREAEWSLEVGERLRALREGDGDGELEERSDGIGVSILANSGDKSKAERWEFTPEPGDASGTKYRLEFRVVGLPRQVLKRETRPYDEQGRTVFARLPVLLLGFDADHRICQQTRILVPVVSEPGGTTEKPILEGTVVVSLFGKGKPVPRDIPATLWAVSHTHRAAASRATPGTGPGPR